MPTFLRVNTDDVANGNVFDIIEGETFADVARQFNDSDLTHGGGAYLKDMLVLGNNLDRGIWVLIGLFRECRDETMAEGLTAGYVDNDITAIVFANSEANARTILATHPYYYVDLMRELPAGHDPLTFLFDDESLPFAGSWVRVPEDQVNRMRMLIAMAPLDDAA